MKRLKEYDVDQNYLISFDSQKFFPKGSYEYFIADVLKTIVKEDEFYPEEIDKGGAEAHNPKAILGILLYGFSKGIFSFRKMAEKCLHDVAFIYISGYTTPDHSTISRFAGNFKEQITRLFGKLLYIAAEQGYIDYDLTATDGTKILANASEKFSGTIEDFEKRKKKLEEKIKEAMAKSEQEDKEEEKEYWNKKKERYEADKNKIENFLKDLEEITRENGKAIKQNITDNDARTMKIEGKKCKPAYNTQATVCGKNGLIVAADVTNEANDVHQLQPMLELTEELAPEQLKENFQKGKHLLDNGYNSVENAVYADENNLDTYIPAGTTKDLYGSQTEEGEIEAVGIKNCEIEKNGMDAKIICPGKLELTNWTITKIKKEDYYHFVVKEIEKCKVCPFFSRCYGKIKSGKKKGFRIKKELLDNWELIQANRAKIESEEGKRIYSKRIGAIEKAFAHIKENMGYKRMLIRGIKKVKTVWSMLCTTYNIVRLFNLKFPDHNKGSGKICWELLPVLQ